VLQTFEEFFVDPKCGDAPGRHMKYIVLRCDS
jgi:hypothetical protein